MINRRKTRQISVGRVRIGGNAPVSVQSMLKEDTRNVAACLRQAKALEKAGCEILRIAIKDKQAADALLKIKKICRIPIEADIHFNYKLALSGIDKGADAIRLNPGNIYRRDEIRQVISAARQNKIPIRVGVNSGSLRTRGDAVKGMVKSARDYIKILEALDFYEIMISLKASDVPTTVKAYRLMAGLCDYPFHLGVTATGLPEVGIVKSSIGIGALLVDGIGDTIRVSLSGYPVDEVKAGRQILKSLGLRKFGPEIIACPTCGRCRIDVIGIAKKLERKLTTYNLQLTTRPLKVAVMGCEVNGPGEAKDADIGIAGGDGCGILFKQGKIISKLKEKDFVNALVADINTHFKRRPIRS
ncbi:MAG: flavodoxin-dependent (E)-4-hydroxy-3-methylbut-2-enyl-diphosphate synthase [Candidatus Omnitrophota bacterium]